MASWTSELCCSTSSALERFVYGNATCLPIAVVPLLFGVATGDRKGVEVNEDDFLCSGVAYFEFSRAIGPLYEFADVMPTK